MATHDNLMTTELPAMPYETASGTPDSVRYDDVNRREGEYLKEGRHVPRVKLT